MSNNQTSLQLKQQSQQLNMVDLPQFIKLSELIYESKILPATVNKQQVTMLLLKGHSLGFHPMQSVDSLQIIYGKVVLTTKGMQAIVKASGLLENERITYDEKAQKMSISIKRKGSKDFYNYSFSLEEAKAALLYDKTKPSSTWVKYLKQMLEAKVISHAYNHEFTDILMGLAPYTSEASSNNQIPEEDKPTETEISNCLETEIVEPEIVEPRNPAREQAANNYHRGLMKYFPQLRLTYTDEQLTYHDAPEELDNLPLVEIDRLSQQLREQIQSWKDTQAVTIVE